MIASKLKAVINRSCKRLLTSGSRSSQTKFGDKASDVLLRDLYINDGLKSVSTVDQALELIQCSQAMCAKDNLRLHKFASYSRDVLEALPANDRAKNLKDLNL